MSKPHVFTLMNEKGGVGKTTLAVHTAAGLAIRGKRVVLIDADPQGHAGIALGVKKQPKLHDLVVRDEEWADCIVPVAPERYASADMPSSGELYVVPGNIETRAIPLSISHTEIMLERIEELEGHMDVIVFDTPPTPSLFHGAIYMATDSILYPTQPAAFSMDGLSESIKHREQARRRRYEFGLNDIKVAGIIPNMYQAGHNAHDFGLKKMIEKYKNTVWGAMPMRTGWQKAQYARRTVFAWNPQDEAAVHGMAMVKRVEKVIA